MMMLRSQSSLEQGPRVAGWAKPLKSQKIHRGSIFVQLQSDLEVKYFLTCYCPVNVYLYKISSQHRKIPFQINKMGTEDYFLFYFFGTKARITFLNV